MNLITENRFRLIIFRRDFLHEQVQTPTLTMAGLSRHSRLTPLREEFLTLDPKTAAHRTAVPNTAHHSTMDRTPRAVLITIDRRNMDLNTMDLIMLGPVIPTLANLGLIIPTLNTHCILVTRHLLDQRPLSAITTRLRRPCRTLW